VPAPIREDYNEAHLILNDSPKAAATLARRALQTCIRDFWGVKDKKNLYQEIEAIKDNIDTATAEAIDAVRSIGNIGAHMEKDINLIVDVEPGEADLLLQLIETVVADWYVARHKRAMRLANIKQLGADKAQQKAAPTEDGTE